MKALKEEKDKKVIKELQKGARIKRNILMMKLK